MRLFTSLVLLVLSCGDAYAFPPSECAKLKRLITVEAQARFGMNAPIPMLAGMIYQESSCNPKAHSWDGGEGLGQLTGAKNIAWIAKQGGLGVPDTFSPKWNLQASFWLLDWAYKNVLGVDDCQRFAAALVAYNAGLGNVLGPQGDSDKPGIWFGATENIPTSQSRENFLASRKYPHAILFTHQPKFSGWGRSICREV